MKKEERLQSKSDKPKEEIVIDYNKPMQTYEYKNIIWTDVSKLTVSTAK